MALPVLRLFSLIVVLLLLPVPNTGAAPPVFDVHIHYSHDAWDRVSPEEAIAKLREVGITRAMVSSSSDEGTRMLYKAAPDMIVPALRSYQVRKDLETWMHDDKVLPFLEQRLAKYRYAAIGEFHLTGEEADLPVPRGLVKLAKKHKLMLFAHIDADGLERLFRQDPDARILWAHAGFEDAEVVRAMMDRYENLWADLSYRYDAFPFTEFAPGWKELLIDHSDRFMLGVDPYTPERWLKMQGVMDWYNLMFEELPEDVVENMRYRNAERVIEWKQE